jgi:hypothetical protein
MRDGKKCRVVLYYLVGISLFMLIQVSSLTAQPDLTFKRVTVNWPTVELYFTVVCDGEAAYDMTKQDFRIYENGIQVRDFTLWCPEMSKPCPKSVVLVFDASGSMSGVGQAGAKQAGHGFIDLMDGVNDEAAVLWFTSVVTLYQQMTSNKPMLHSAVDALPASGMTAVWDGGYAGLIELINNGVNQCRAVILMTDGPDNASTRTPAEIIALAKRHIIPIFTVGLGSVLDSDDLQMIADSTGGRYYQTSDAAQLAAMYREIYPLIIGRFDECIITYDRDCADHALRTVDLELRDFCAGSDVRTRTYRAPLDSMTFRTLVMQLGRVEGRAAADIAIPLNLLTSIDNDLLYPFQFTLEFDSACVQFMSVSTPPGSLLEGASISVTPAPSGVLIEVKDQKLINGHGPLMEFAFVASDLADTTSCEIRAVGPTFEQGCFVPIIDPGEIRIYPRNTTISSGGFMLPRSTHLLQCHPNPFNPTTVIPYRLGELTDYSLTLYDVLGRRLRVLEAGRKEAGSYHYEFDAGDLTSGVYLYRLETPTFSDTKRMILSR